MPGTRRGSRARYWRKGIKWAKVSGQRGAWRVACGWRGEVSANPLDCHNTDTLRHATVIAENWVDDQPQWAIEKYAAEQQRGAVEFE